MRRTVGASLGVSLLVIATAAPTVTLEDQLVAPLVADDLDLFGNAVAVAGDLAAVGAREFDPGRPDTGFVIPYERVGGAWTPEPELVGFDSVAGDTFGTTLALEGDTLAVGASFVDGIRANQGAVYVFVRVAGAWVHQARLEASDPGSAAGFGTALALEGDVLVVGTSSDEPAGIDAGSAYVFRRTGAAWTQEQKLTPADAAERDQFGGAVALSGDTIVVGAFRADAPVADSGAAYVFDRILGVWTETAKLGLAVPEDTDNFGSAVALAGDRALVGAFRDGSAEAGSVTEFVRVGGVWSETATLLPSGGFGADHFGYSLHIDGATLIVGARGAYHAAVKGGAAHVFRRLGPTWTETLKLVASDATLGAGLGSSVAIDGATALVGAPRADRGGLDRGAAYFYDDVVRTTPPGPPPASANGFLSPTRVRLVGTTLTVSATLDLGDKAVDFADPVELVCGPRTIEMPGGLTPNRRRSSWAYTSPDRNTRVNLRPPNRRQGHSKGRISMVIRDWTEPLPPHPGGAGELLELGLTCGSFDVDSAVQLDGGRHEANVQTAGAPPLVLDRVAARLRGPHTPSISVTASFAGDALLPPGPPAVALRMGEPGNLYEVLLPTPDHVVTPTPSGWIYTVPDPDGVGPLVPQGAWRVDVDYVRRQVQVSVRGEDLGSFSPRSAPFYFSLSLGGDEHAVQVCVDVCSRTRLSYR